MERAICRYRARNRENVLIFAFLRHPRPANCRGRCYGRIDLNLASGAEKQTDRMIGAITHLRGARVWSSPARRCLEPAYRIATALGCLPPLVDERLSELHFGDWEGMNWDDIDRSALDNWAADPMGFRAPGGESGEQLLARVEEFYCGVRRFGGDHIVMTHGGPLKILLPLARGEKPDILLPAPVFASVTIVAAG